MSSSCQDSSLKRATAWKLLEGWSNRLIACAEACEAPRTLGTGRKMFKQRTEVSDIDAGPPHVHLRFVEFATHRYSAFFNRTNLLGVFISAWSCCLPRVSLDITVPIGSFRASEISR